MQWLRVAALQWIFLMVLLCSGLAYAQDKPGKFEIGANLTAIRNPELSSEAGLGAEGDFNFSRHFALDIAGELAAVQHTRRKYCCRPIWCKGGKAV